MSDAPRALVDMSGAVMAGWTVLARAGKRDGGAAWHCRHDCVKAGERVIMGTALRGPVPPKYCDGCRPRHVGKKNPKETER